MGLNNIFKKGGAVKKCAEGGSLKAVDSEENPGLAKLPTHVRNKMGYAKKGGEVKKYQMGGMIREKLPQDIVDEVAREENMQGREMVAGPLRKLKNMIMGGPKAKAPSAPVNKGDVTNKENALSNPYKKGGKVKKMNMGGPTSQTAQEIIEGKRPVQATPGKMTPEERRASIAKAFGAK